MKIKPVIPREQANQDVDDAIAHYLKEASSSVALGFIDALERGYTHIGRHPGTGSPRHGHELDLPGLRAWALSPPRWNLRCCPAPACAWPAARRCRATGATPSPAAPRWRSTA